MKTTLTTTFAFALMSIGFAGFTLTPAAAQEDPDQAKTANGGEQIAIDTYSDDSSFEDWLPWLNPNWFSTENDDSELAGFQYCEDDNVLCLNNGWNDPDRGSNGNERVADVARESGPDRAASCTDAADCPGGSPAQGGTAARTPNDRVAETGYY